MSYSASSNGTCSALGPSWTGAGSAPAGPPGCGGGEDDGLARGVQLAAQLVDLAYQLAVLLWETPGYVRDDP